MSTYNDIKLNDFTFKNTIFNLKILFEVYTRNNNIKYVCVLGDYLIQYVVM